MKLRIIYTLLIFIISTSCKTGFRVQVYKFQPKFDFAVYNKNEVKLEILEHKKSNIILKNDSILEYCQIWGGIGSVITTKYYLKDNLVTIDSIDIYGSANPKEFRNMTFFYSPDSLINSKTSEKFYNTKYIERISKIDKY